MLKIKIVAVGKIKDRNLKDFFGEYLKRLAPYAWIENIELEAEPFSESSDKARIKNKEGDKIKKFLNKNLDSQIIILDERGKILDSQDFSKLIFKDESCEIIFVIGGALGLSEEILNYKNSIKLSFSKMTFLHEMTRIILVEQIFRAVAIEKNKKYHY